MTKYTRCPETGAAISIIKHTEYGDWTLEELNMYSIQLEFEINNLENVYSDILFEVGRRKKLYKDIPNEE